MIPRWLQVELALAGGIIIAVPLYAVILLAVGHGEPSFTALQKVQLTEDFPGGTFVDDHTYKWCGGQQWYIFDPRGNNSNIGGSCIRWR